MRRCWLILLCLIAAPLCADTPHLEVATWNLEWFNHAQRGFPENTRGGPSYGPRDAEGLDAVAGVITRHGLEVVGLQEIQSEEDLQSLLDLLPDYQMYVVPDRSNLHCALIWDTRVVTVQLHPPFAALAVTSGQRQGLHASLKCGEFSFDYMVVHLASKDEQMATQTQLLNHWISGLLPDSAPQDDDVIIGGDFNLSAEEPSFATLLAGDILAWCFSGLAEVPPTRPRLDGGGRTIDHLFMTWNTYWTQRLGDVQVPREDQEYGERFRELVSDHLPVFQSFRTDQD